MKRAFLLILLINLMAGCATHQDTPLSTKYSANFQGKTFMATSEPQLDFSLRQGISFMDFQNEWKKGGEFRAENNIPDPGKGITATFSDLLRTKYGLTELPNKGVTTSRHKVSDLLETYSGADYVLDVNSWAGIVPTLGPVVTPLVVFGTRVSLIDSDMSEEVMTVQCIETTDRQTDGSFFDLATLSENEAALAKETLTLLASRVTECLKEKSGLSISLSK